MITLRRLQAISAIAADLVEVQPAAKDLVSASEFEQMSDEERAADDRVVTVDNPVWIATTKGRSAKESNAVYSCNADEVIGNWSAKNGRFAFMKLQDSTLYVTKQIKKSINNKEDKKMADILKEIAEMEGTQKMDAFNTEGASAPVAAPEKKGGKAKVPSASEEACEKIMDAVSGVGIQLNQNVISNNRKFGRLIAFITRTNNVVKLRKVKKALKDSDGKQIVNEEAYAEYEKDHPDKAKSQRADGKLPVKCCQQTHDIDWVDAKPSTPIGAIIATPICSDISVTGIDEKVAPSIDASLGNDLQVHIMSKEAAFTYLAWNYGDKIHEDEKVVGPDAAFITVSHTPGKQKEDAAASGGVNKPKVLIRSSFKVDTSVRKSVLCATNYFPLKTFQTVSVASDPAKANEYLSTHLAAIFSKEPYDNFSEDVKAAVTVDGDGYKCNYLANGKTPTIRKFDGKTDADVISTVTIPVRTAAPAKKGDGMTYSFAYNDLNSEQGPIKNGQYQAIIAATGLDVDAFKTSVEKIGKTKSGSKAQGKRTIDFKAFLQSLSVPQKVGNVGMTRRLVDLQDEIAGIK